MERRHRALTIKVRMLILFLSCAFSAFSITTSDLEKETALMTIYDILDESESYAYKDFELALLYNNLAYKRALISKDARTIFECVRSLGLICEHNNSFPKALEHYQQANIIAGNLPITDQLTITTDIAIIHKKLGNFKISKEFHTKALDMAQQVGDQEMIEDNYHGLGNLYNIAGDYDKALEYFYQSLNVAESRKDKNGIIVTLQEISAVFVQTKKPEKAQDFINRAYNMALEIKDSTRIASVLNSYGSILRSVNQLDGALEKHKYALVLFELTASKTDIAKSQIAIADVYIKLNQYPSAEKYLLDALQNVDFLYNYDKAQLYQKLGEYYKHQNSLLLAKKYYFQSIALAEKYDFKDVAQLANYNLYKLSKLTGDTDGAIKYLERADALSDSLYNQEKSKRMAEMEFRFDLEKGEKEIQQLKLRENKLTLAAGTIISVVAVGFLLFIVFMRGANNKNLKLKNLAIHQQNQKLEESNEVLRQFAYASAHDLKEPLRNIGSFVSLIQRRFMKDLPDEAQEYMGFVTTGVKRMNNLLEDLLKYSTLITDKQPDKEMIDLKDIVNIVSSNLQNTIESKQAEIRLGDKLPQVEMNRLHLTQLFQNLISNSLKFVHDKPPIVQINGQSKNGEVMITVQDNGIGIKQEYSAKVFQLFHRLNKTNQQFEGTGIGLTICKNIVEKYNGRIWFESVENNGTTFFITFPETKAA
jgi:signal transduction histidine kinase